MDIIQLGTQLLSEKLGLQETISGGMLLESSGGLGSLLGAASSFLK